MPIKWKITKVALIGGYKCCRCHSNMEVTNFESSDWEGHKLLLFLYEYVHILGPSSGHTHFIPLSVR